MTQKRRLFQLLALFCAFAIMAAACGDSDDGDSGDTGDSTTTEAESTTTEGDAGGTTETSEGESTETSAAAGDAAMTLTIDLNPEAVWSDGTPITSKTCECTRRRTHQHAGRHLGAPATTASPRSSMGESDKQAVVTFDRVWAPYKDLFDRIIPAHSSPNCDDVSADMRDSYPVSGRPYQLESFSADQIILTPNPNYWVRRTPVAQRVVMVPRTDDGGVARSLQAGEVDFIFPQAFAGITDALARTTSPTRPATAPTTRACTSSRRKAGRSPTTTSGTLLDVASTVSSSWPTSTTRSSRARRCCNCGLWVPTIGPWCDNTQFENSFDPAAAATLLEGEGWTKNADGFWEKDGVVPEIRWMVNAPQPAS